MKVIIKRGLSTDQGTFGVLTLPDLGLSWSSLELPWRDNKPGVSCIDPGAYTARVKWSNHFQKMLYHINDQHGRQGVEIHAGNFAGDTLLCWKSDVLGCIMLGTVVDKIMIDKSGRLQRALLHSGVALVEFMTATNGAPLEIEIT